MSRGSNNCIPQFLTLWHKHWKRVQKDLAFGTPANKEDDYLLVSTNSVNSSKTARSIKLQHCPCFLTFAIAMVSSTSFLISFSISWTRKAKVKDRKDNPFLTVIVLANQNSRQIPERRDVQSLKQLSLRSAAGEVDAVVPVSGNNAILSGNRGLHTYRDGFLAVVEMAKSANKLRLVERIGGDLHPAHQSHIAEERHQLLRRRLYGARRRIDVVTAEREAGLHGDGGGGVR
nr:hypothetical protein Pyn_24018 [Ipomoea batatas]